MTKQIEAWRSEFGDAYTDRNLASPQQLRARVALWAEILGRVSPPPRSILEVGANRGMNLRALRSLSDARFFALEPNDKARAILVSDGVVAASDVRAGAASAIDFGDGIADLAFTCGVLIHVHPDELAASIAEIHRCSRRWIACIEYFADQPEQIQYRGHSDLLFKRDFGGFWLDSYPDLRVAGYGFAWRRATGLDNLNWWLFEKPGVRDALRTP
jgi:pseudaminic acid biosynthesis-associated methylase